MADELKATLRCASGEAHTGPTITSGVAAATQGTQANLKDGSDTTGSKLQVQGDDVAAGNATYREEWTLDALAYAGAISFIRIKIRHDFENVGAAGDGSGSVRPSINGTSRGSTVASAAAVAVDSQDFATDPDDGLPWTQAKLAAKKLGWFLQCQTISAGSDDLMEQWVRDYAVEVWGPEVKGGLMTMGVG